MKSVLYSIVTSLMLVITLSLPASATVETYVQHDETPDLVLVVPNAPATAYDATDLVSVRAVQHRNTKPRTTKVVFNVVNYDPSYIYEVGGLMKVGNKTGQIYGSPGGPVNERPDFAGNEAYYCGKSSVTAVGNKVIMKFTNFCSPYRHGSFRFYASTYTNDKAVSPVGMDSFNTLSKVFDFSYK